MSWRFNLRGVWTRILVVTAAVLGLCQSQAMAQNQAGVAIDAFGVLSLQNFADPTGALIRERVQAAKAALDPKFLEKSGLRKISLRRLEAALAAQLDQSRPATDEMKYLAGLTKIQYVFYYPETQDIVIAGPAEPWVADLSGRVRGTESGLPTMLLEDLLVALRAFPPGSADDPQIGCSIDPTQEGLARMQDFMRNANLNSGPEVVADGIRNAMGLQDISVLGISPNTHFAQVMVEADYRMKLIGIGVEKPPVKLVSYVERANPRTLGGGGSLARWYFTPNYECVRVSQDGLGMELVGSGVKLVGENELIGSDGARSQAASKDAASQAFVQEFTKVYADLASKAPVFGQLRNLIDLSVMAAYLQQNDLYGQASWTADTFRDETKLPVEILDAPKQVQTVVTHLSKGRRVCFPTGGGVDIQPKVALQNDNLLPDENADVQKAREEQTPPQLADNQWWWD